jgi:hypothetical protein
LGSLRCIQECGRGRLILSEKEKNSLLTFCTERCKIRTRTKILITFIRSLIWQRCYHFDNLEFITYPDTYVSRLSIYGGLATEDFIYGRQFAIRVQENWLSFWLLTLDEDMDSNTEEVD